jgi:hypothetical protein
VEQAVGSEQLPHRVPRKPPELLRVEKPPDQGGSRHRINRSALVGLHLSSCSSSAIRCSRESRRRSSGQDGSRAARRSIEGVRERVRQARAPYLDIADSGATCTMFNKRRPFTGPLDGRRGRITLASDDAFVPSYGKGEAGSYGPSTFAPGLGCSLISTVQDDVENGLWTVMGGGKVVVMDQPPALRGNTIRRGQLADRQYVLEQSYKASGSSEQQAAFLRARQRVKAAREAAFVDASTRGEALRGEPPPCSHRP